MMLHPLVLSIWLVDITAWIIYIGAAWRLLVLLPQWQPGAGDAGQLWRERALELTGFQGRWTMALLTTSLVLVLVGLTNVWPPYVPGAMCGTGVLQAMGPNGRYTLIFRVLTLLILYCWHVALRLANTSPEGGLAQTQGRLLLLAGPLIVLSTLTFGQAFSAIVPEAPVSCCALLYDQARGSDRMPLFTASLLSDRAWLTLSFAGAFCVAGGAWAQLRWPALFNSPLQITIAALLFAWLPVAVLHLKGGVAPYIYQVLWHPCPWCLFLTLHGAVGFVYFGLLAWIVAETAAGLTARTIVRNHPQFDPAARMRVRLAGRRILAGALLFAALAALPAMLWRIQSGGWLG